MKRMVLNEAKAPCMDCADRMVGCQIRCPMYRAYADECAKNRHRRWLEKDVDRAVSEAIGRYPGERRV